MHSEDTLTVTQCYKKTASCRVDHVQQRSDRLRENAFKSAKFRSFIFYTRMRADAGNKRYIAGYDELRRAERHQPELSAASADRVYTRH